jgi:hypothetical protein
MLCGRRVSANKFCRIAEVCVSEGGELLVFPCPNEAPDFSWIYRAALEVSWDPNRGALVTPPPVTGTYPERFGFVVGAARSEYGVSLRLTSATRWTDVPEAVRAEIEAQPSLTGRGHS